MFSDINQHKYSGKAFLYSASLMLRRVTLGSGKYMLIMPIRYSFKDFFFLSIKSTCGKCLFNLVAAYQHIFGNLMIYGKKRKKF